MVRTLPHWLTIRPPSGGELALFQNVSGTLQDLNLYTICETGKCPNRGECWGSGTATFLLMGDMCTRRCHFCNCGTAAKGEELQSDEPEKILQAVKRLKLSYVVLTSVARDDLPDQGSRHIAATIRAIKTGNPNVSVEALIPDFQGNEEFLANVANSGVDVLCHNIEVVKELQKSVRDYRAGYDQSLAVLSNAKKINPRLVTKSSIMLGLGETAEQIGRTMDDLRKAGVDALTIGQYLQPNKKCLPVKEFVTPEKFEEYRKLGMEKGFKFVVAGPFVRSSYKAAEALAQGLMQNKRAGNDDKGTKPSNAVPPTAELKHGKSIFKAGKLIKVFLDYDDCIRGIKITGDFFLHPEEKIFEIEKGLAGTPINESAIKGKLQQLLSGADAFGFDAGQLAQAIMAAANPVK